MKLKIAENNKYKFVNYVSNLKQKDIRG